MAVLFDCSADNIGLHLKNIYDTNELNKEATTEKISVVQQEGAREVRRNTLFYNLDAIISVGYRVNSIRATQFRQWCTYVIRQFSLRGYIIDKKRMENGSFIGEDYFEHLTPSETPQKHQEKKQQSQKRQGQKRQWQNGKGKSGKGKAPKARKKPVGNPTGFLYPEN